MLTWKIKSKNGEMKIIAALLVVIILIVASLVIINPFEEEEKKEEQPVKEIDDRISPLVNQAVFLEIHRIRRNGIIDQIENAGNAFVKNLIQNLPFRNYRIPLALEGMRPGKGWDEKPSYSFIATLDDYEEIGKPTYNDWDTGYINQVIWRNVEDEQPTTIIDFKVIENVKTKKLFKTTTQKVEKEHFSVIYDFKTGHWDGDDYFNDTDGYGHYLGENYEIWFSLTQTSKDQDTIPYWTEVNILGTDPEKDDSKLDPDNDGIPTQWEWKWGYDPFTWDNHSCLDPDLDGLQNTEEYYMEKWLANPYTQEIYIEADYMEPTPKKFNNKDGFDGWTHEFYEESQQMLIERFSQHGISMHIDDGRMGGGADPIPFSKGGGEYGQDTGIVAGHYANDFEDDRKGIFRYLVVAYGGGWAHPQDEKNWYDCMTVPHNAVFFKNQLGYATTDRTIRIGQAVQVMHELGHTCGLNKVVWAGVDNASGRHGDPPDYPWWDYVSCMNYDYFWQRVINYSDGTHGEYDFDDWDYLDLPFFNTPSARMEGLGS